MIFTLMKNYIYKIAHVQHLMKKKIETEEIVAMLLQLIIGYPRLASYFFTFLT